MSPARQKKANEKRIERAYYASCNGVAIDMMDIGKVWKLGEDLVAQGCDDATLGTNLREYVDTIRKW